MPKRKPPQPERSYDRLERESCHGKQAYMSLREAEDAAVAMFEKVGEELKPYSCPFCLLHHIGHLPKPSTLKLLERARRALGYSIR